MWALAIFSLALGVVQYSQAQKAADKQEAIARENARLQQLETEEAVRREQKAAASQEASSRARAAASGVTLSGSVTEYLDEQQQANADRIRWLKESGTSRADIIASEGKAAADTTRSNALGSLASSATNAYGYWKNL